MAEKEAKAETAQAAVKTEEKAAAAEKAAEAAEKSAESGSKAESEPAAEKAGGLPFTAKDGRATVVSKARAGKKIIAKTGEVIEFDAEGKASVRAEDALYLSAIAGFEFE